MIVTSRSLVTLCEVTFQFVMVIFDSILINPWDPAFRELVGRLVRLGERAGKRVKYDTDLVNQRWLANVYIYLMPAVVVVIYHFP